MFAKANVLKESTHYYPFCCHVDEPIAYLQNRGSERLESFQSKAFVTAGAKLAKAELANLLFDRSDPCRGRGGATQLAERQGVQQWRG